MDVQTCLIDLASYAYTSDDIEYKWKEKDPVQLKPGLEFSMPSFQLTQYNTTYCTSVTNTGTYSCLRTIMQLQRQFRWGVELGRNWNLPTIPTIPLTTQI